MIIKFHLTDEQYNQLNMRVEKETKWAGNRVSIESLFIECIPQIIDTGLDETRDKLHKIIKDNKKKKQS